LPLVLVVTNNQYAYSTPNSKQFACKNLVDRAQGYGIEGHTMDGTDLKECLETTLAAVDRARAGKGPQLIVASCLRLSGHGEHDDASYVDPQLKKAQVGRDCLQVAEQTLVSQQWASKKELNDWKQSAKRQVEEVVQKVQGESQPDPTDKIWEALSTRELVETL
jgi:acetoin:2,6-dichlorophenolindophenol oxidoreductase subunit alpha